ncbi:MAG: hypothetical protein DWP97_01305 [Calditrichaeota bacterium]|nr:MAG: hypothetical protein DWP97_01305 [Calditrichota bacterium]
MRKRKKKISIVYILIILLFILLFRLVEDVGDDTAVPGRFTVVKVIDGDTFEITGGDRVRILSVDTPEKDELYYDEAKSFVNDLLLGKVVNLEYGSYRRDRYGRLLAYVYLDSVFVNKAILDNGLGYLYLFKDNAKNRRTSELLHSQIEAITNKDGIWSLEKIEEDYYLSSPGSYRLHRPGCNSLKLSEENYIRYSSRLDGYIEGLSPCRNCRP